MNKSYLAGIIDGEGYIGLIKSRTGKPNVVVSVVNTFYPLVEKLQAEYGGHIRLTTTSKRDGFNRKPCYEWRVFCSKAIQVLRDVIPSLWLKKERGFLVLKYNAMNSACGAKRGKPVPLALRDMRETFFNRMKELTNKRTVI